MSYTTLVLVVAASWLSIGLTLSLTMGRRGHDAFSWLILGTLFGPLGAIFAVEARGQEEARAELVAPHGPSGAGPVDVLVGTDGSPESMAALRAAFEILGSRLGRLTLATVIPFDCGIARQRSAREDLERAGSLIGGEPQLEVLYGRPAQALLDRAVEGGYELLVIGTRGTGASKALLGSTAADISQSSKLPVLLMGDGSAT
ncbi:MAG TPA: universal stress protein [Acidimicrobiia bacterium]|nr:universal stress protein [Acidimicrobiia bacterium]